MIQNPDFLAHPLSLIKLQALTLALPHHVLLITAPFKESYAASLRNLRDELDSQAMPSRRAERAYTFVET